MSETGRRIIAAVRKAADQMPFHRQQGKCVYVNNGSPSCLIGAALWEVGLIDASLEARGLNDEPVRELLGLLGIEVDDTERRWLEHAQAEQDTLNAWGLAVRNADRAVPPDLGEWSDRVNAVTVAARAIRAQGYVPGLSDYVATKIAAAVVIALIDEGAVELPGPVVG